MKIYVFPGQGSQFEGMGKDLYESSEAAKEIFEQANDILGYRISDIMFEGSAEDLKQTKITQPAVFLHSIVKAKTFEGQFAPKGVAGHSLGEFSALVVNNCLSFEEGLMLVYKRAMAMQAACEQTEGTMAAILGLDDELVEEVCTNIEEVVVPANYNCPGQLVISGSVKGVETATTQLKEKGARKAVILAVGGAFHSPLMEPAKKELAEAIAQTTFNIPICPIYQNVTGLPENDPEKIKQNLVDQLTAPVKWTQTMKNMITDGMQEYIEVGGSGKVLRGFLRRLDRQFASTSI